MRLSKIPVYNLASIGLIKDRDPFDVPLNGFNEARNVRFFDGAAQSFDIFKKLDVNSELPSGLVPTSISDGSYFGGRDTLNLIAQDGTIRQLNGNSYVDVSPDPILSPTSKQASHTTLGNVNYLHTEGNAPVFQRINDLSFERIPGWSPTDFCFSFRSYRDFLIALNVSKDGVRYPGMVKWSDAAEAGQPPDNWSVTDNSSLAGENVLNQLRGVILDGQPLGNSFLIYGTSQVFRMDFTGDELVFAFNPLFDDLGVINKNCVSHIGSLHYVFSNQDIIIHDGVEKQSIADLKVRRYIFDRIDLSFVDRFFTFFNASSSDLYFCYKVTDSSVAFPDGTTGCNEAAVYNVVTKTWSFVDLPDITSICMLLNTDTVTWDSLDIPWESLTISWRGASGSSTEIPFAASGGLFGRPPEVLIIDGNGVGRTSAQAVTEYLTEGFLEASFKDFTEYGINLSSRKIINSIHFQIRTLQEADYVIIYTGSSESPLFSPTFNEVANFYPWTMYKHDSRSAGRYLSARIVIPKGTWAEIYGYDLDLGVISGR